MTQRTWRPHPATIRSSVILELAGELIKRDDLPYEQAQLTLRKQGDEQPRTAFWANGTPGDVAAVARREADLGIANPSSLLTLAYRGTATFSEPIPLRAITVIPSYDQLMLAVAGDTGLESVEDVGRKRYPLKISLRGQRDHSIHLVVDHVLHAAGFSLADVISWGGSVRYDEGLPNQDNRLGAVERGEVNAVVDEAVRNWGNRALDTGMRVLPLEETALATLVEYGYRRSMISPERFPKLTVEVPTIDFSGWTLFTHRDTPDDLVRAVCEGLEARRGTILWQTAAPLPLEEMCTNTEAAPLDVPLHPAAEQYWRERGYLT